MSLASVSLDWNRRQRLIGRRGRDLVEPLWRSVDSAHLSETWIRALPRATATVAAGMRTAAAGATAYTQAAVLQQDGAATSVGQVNAAAFGLSATDGRPLGSLLYTPVIGTQRRLAAGQSPQAALVGGLQDLQMIVTTELADASRLAVGVAMTADRQVRGYYREVGPKACSRCAVLAGRWYSTAAGAGFERHPQCQCTATPALDRAKGNPSGYSPMGYFRSLTAGQQDRVFTAAGAQAIRDGADIDQVVNARAGMSDAGSWTTTAGTSRRGLYGGYERRPDGTLVGRPADGQVPPRLTPQAIYRLAASRDEAIDMLRRYGYLI